MEKNNHIPLLRQKNIKMMFVFSIILFPVLSLLHGFHAGRLLTSCCIQIVFWSTFIYQLESSRMDKSLKHSNITDYHDIKECYFAALVLTGILSFVPGFYKPLWILPLLLALMTNEDISFSMGLYLVLNLLFAQPDTSAEECITAMLLCACAWTLSKGLHSEILLKYSLIILLFAQCILNGAGYYALHQVLHWYVIFGNLILASAAMALFLFLTKEVRMPSAEKILSYEMDLEEDDDDTEEIVTFEEYMELLRDSFPLVKDIRTYSMKEYLRAKKVSKLAGLCTKEVGGNEYLAEAAGFYYRLGLLEGEPIVENGVKLAYDNCLPDTVIEILEEYNGLYRLPQTKESAIIHMVDVCVKKAELLKQNKLNSEWNDTMVIYQTLNEISATGIYDESTLSMNQFLKVRDIMVQEGFQM